MVDEQAVIRALTQVSEVVPDKDGDRSRLPVITISRTMGAGGDEIGRMVAERMDLPCYSREVLDKVAKEAKVHESLLNKLHERLSQAGDAWLYSLLFGANVTRDDYLHRLVTTVRGLYQAGGVIMGRGGNIILAGRKVLRVRITGSVDASAKRLALQCGWDLDEARRKVRESNKARGEFTWKVFKRRANDLTNYDLAINTDHFEDFGHVADLIVHAASAMGIHTAHHHAKKK
ncbi:MAG: cytidylate kinase-like family protein [Magnetospirillum sp. WYHS-4]